MFLRLPSSHQRSVRALLSSCQHTSRCHGVRAFPIPATPASAQFRRHCHVPAARRMTRPVTVGNRKSLSLGYELPLNLVLSPRHTRVVGARAAVLHSSARRSVKLVKSPSSTSVPSVRLFSEIPSCGAQNLAKELDTIIMGASGNKPAQEDAGNSRNITNGEDHAPRISTQDGSLDPESDEEVPVEAEELQHALTRPPAVNSSYLPLPWQGRLGYVSLSCQITLSVSTFS